MVFGKIATLLKKLLKGREFVCQDCGYCYRENDAHTIILNAGTDSVSYVICCPRCKSDRKYEGTPKKEKR